MRDPDYVPTWSDTFTFRVKYQEPSNTSTGNKDDLSGSVPAIVDTVVETDAPLDEFDFDSFLRSDCKVMRFSSRSSTSLRSLPPTSLVLLLTPVLAPWKIDLLEPETTEKETDPFEVFGRELSKLHRRLRHVPYVPKIGLTETHSAFVEQAAAVVVVVCESANLDQEILEDQQTFANRVLASRRDLPSGDVVPFVLVQFSSRDDDLDDDQYSDVLRAPSLDKHAALKAAQLLFKPGAVVSTDSVNVACCVP